MISKDKLISSIALIILLILGSLLINSNNDLMEEQIDKHSKEILASQAFSLKRSISESILSANILGKHIELSDGKVHDFENLAKELLIYLPGISNLQLAPAGIVSKIYPLEGNEKAIGHDVFKSDNRKKEAFLAKDSRKFTLAGPFKLIQGGVGIIARNPIYIKDKFWGFSSTLILIDELLKTTDLKKLKNNNYLYRLKRVHPDTNKLDIFAGTKKFPNKKIFSKKIILPNTQWFIDIVYIGSYISNRVSYLLYFVLLIISILLSYLLYLLLNKANEAELQKIELKKKVLLQTSEIKNNLETIKKRVIYSKTNLSGIITDTSDAFCKISGFTRDELIGKPHNIVRHPDNKKSIYSNMWRILETNKSWFGELKNLKKDGSFYWVYSEISPDYNKDGEKIGYISIRQDITALKELSKQQSYIIEQENRFSSVFQVLPDLLFIMEEDGRIIDYRAQINSDLYVNPEVFIGNRMQDILPEKTGDIFSENIKELSKDGSLKLFKYELNIENETKYFEARMAKLPEDNHIMTIVRDITTRVLSEQKSIFQSKLLEQAIAGIDVINENGLFYYVNDAYVKMWGYETKEEILKTSPIHHCVDSRIPEKIIKKVEKEGSGIFQFKAKRKDGSIFDVLMSVKYIKLSDKKYYIGSSIDISEREKMREDKSNTDKLLYQQSKLAAMGEMLGNIAHQWRQPLSAISTASTGTKLQKEMDCLSDDQLNNALDLINDSAQYLSTTIDDFRSFFNPNNSSELEFQIEDAITKSLKLIGSQFTAKEIEVIKNIDSVKLFSVENELIQVLINILNNARDALITTKKVRRLIFITAYQKDNISYIEILDNAGGIEDNVMDRVFEPYFTTKYKSQGTGIGLYMSEEIVKNHLNGTIRAENIVYIYDEVEYKGAKFIIALG